MDEPDVLARCLARLGRGIAQDRIYPDQGLTGTNPTELFSGCGPAVHPALQRVGGRSPAGGGAEGRQRGG